MKLLVLLFIFLAGLPGQRAPAPNARSDEGRLNQEKAKTIVDQMIAALGGAAYLNLQDSYSEGRYGRFHNDVTVATQNFFRYWKAPDSERYEITNDRDIVYLYLGEKEYEVTYRGGRELDPAKDENVRQSLVRRRFTLQKVLREWLNQPGTSLFYEGSSLAENRMAERVSIINSNNEAVTLLISTDTHLPFQKIFSVRDPQTRERDEEVETFDSWRLVQGINTAYSTQIARNGTLLRIERLGNVVYNSHPPDVYFTPKLIEHHKK